jgi:hypothetical protein
VSRILTKLFPIGVLTAELIVPELNRRTQTQLELMRTLVAQLPREALGAHTDPAITKHALTATGPEMRALGELLDELDPHRQYGKLEVILSPSGDFLWVCETHHRNYDPDLPNLPSTAIPQSRRA